jgi:hypothetical protein
LFKESIGSLDSYVFIEIRQIKFQSPKSGSNDRRFKNIYGYQIFLLNDHFFGKKWKSAFQLNSVAVNAILVADAFPGGSRLIQRLIGTFQSLYPAN